MQKAIQAEAVSKTFRAKKFTGKILSDLFFHSYESVKAVNSASLEVKDGEIFGLIGANGAGKTTLIKCLSGIIFPDSGSILINNKTPENAKLEIGAMFGNTLLYYRLTGYDNLKFYAKLYGVNGYDERIREISKKFGLEKFLNKYVETYSLGMKTKISLARAMLHDPNIVFLDEPTLGLDPVFSAAIRKMIKHSGKTIFITSHYMEEVEELCDRIAFISRGNILAIGTAEQLKKSVEKHAAVIVETGFEPKLVEQLKKSEFVIAVYHIRKGLKILLKQDSDLPSLLKILAQHNIKKIQEREASLEDVFVKLAGEEIGI